MDSIVNKHVFCACDMGYTSIIPLDYIHQNDKSYSYDKSDRVNQLFRVEYGT